MSSSILDRPTPFSEANWKEIQTGAKYGVSEESLQKDFGASPKSSGSEAKEPKTAVASDQEDEKAAKGTSTKNDCAFCSGDHSVGNCPLANSFSVCDADVNPYYYISCNYCGSEMKKDLICPQHKCMVEAHLTPKFCSFCDDYVEHRSYCCPNTENEYFKMMMSENFENMKCAEPVSRK